MNVIGNLQMEQFVANDEKMAAVAFHGIIIGEAANRALLSGHHIEDEGLVGHLQRARLTRNEFVHEYDVLEADNLFVTVTNVYRPLQERIHAYLGISTTENEDDPNTTPGAGPGGKR